MKYSEGCFLKRAVDAKTVVFFISTFFGTKDAKACVLLLREY